MTKWLLLAAIAATTAGPKLPDRLAGYRSWTEISGPRLMTSGTSAACMPMYAAPARTQTGPHGRWTAVYGNAAAMEGLRDEAGEFPAGAIIAKEKLRNEDDEAPDAVAFMIKHAKGERPESGGWEFVYYPAAAKASYQRCVSCHRTGASKDYVFATF